MTTTETLTTATRCQCGHRADLHTGMVWGAGCLVAKCSCSGLAEARCLACGHAQSSHNGQGGLACGEYCGCNGYVDRLTANKVAIRLRTAIDYMERAKAELPVTLVTQDLLLNTCASITLARTALGLAETMGKSSD